MENQEFPWGGQKPKKQCFKYHKKMIDIHEME